MSRSYKKNPYLTDGSRGNKKSGKVHMKNCANRVVRHTPDLPLKGSGYKKTFYSYSICDFRVRGGAAPTKEDKEAYKKWYKLFKRK